MHKRLQMRLRDSESFKGGLPWSFFNHQNAAGVPNLLAFSRRNVNAKGLLKALQAPSEANGALTRSRSNIDSMPS